MASRRMIDPSFWQSETIARLPLSARYLFIGLFSNADDQGRMKANPALIRSKVYPLDDIALDAITKDLELLELGAFIIRYEVDGSRYLQVINWWKHQHPTWAWPSDLPPPEGWQDRACYRKGNTVVKSNWPSDDVGIDGTPGDSGLTVTPPRPHDDAIVTLPPSTSTSTSTSTSKALAVETAPALAVAPRQNEATFAAVVSALARAGINESTVTAHVQEWPHPEHAAALVAHALADKRIKNRAGFVIDALRKGWTPPKDSRKSAAEWLGYDPTMPPDPHELGDEPPPDPPLDVGDAVPYWPESMRGRMDPRTFDNHFRDSRARFVDGKIIISLPPTSLEMVERRLRPIVEQVLAEYGKTVVMEAAP